MPVEIGRRQPDAPGTMEPEMGAQPWDASWNNMGRPSLITDHDHRPIQSYRDHDDRCFVCRLGAAAHARRDDIPF